MASNPPPKPKGGLSLYANLLESSGASAGATITGAPVTFAPPTDAHSEEAPKPQQISACRSAPA